MLEVSLKMIFLNIIKTKANAHFIIICCLKCECETSAKIILNFIILTKNMTIHIRYIPYYSTRSARILHHIKTCKPQC